MPAYNFQKQFVPMILDGTKTQTIRRLRKVRRGQLVTYKPEEAGRVLSLYTGMRTKQCRLLCKVNCVAVRGILIKYDEGVVLGKAEVYLSDRADAFARGDGFADFSDMADWFRTAYGGDSFLGQLIQWSQLDA